MTEFRFPYKLIDTDAFGRLGADHRMERHFYSEDVKNTIKRYWDAKGEGLGEKAVVEWLFHIAIDNLATAFRMSSKSFSYGPKTYNLMEFGFGQIRLSFTASLTE